MADASNTSNWLGTFLVALVPTITWVVRTVLRDHYRRKRMEEKERSELAMEAKRSEDAHAHRKAHGKGSGGG